MKTIIIEPKDNKEFDFYFELANRLGANVRVYEEETQNLQSFNSTEEKFEDPTPANIVLDAISEILTSQDEDNEAHS